MQALVTGGNLLTRCHFSSTAVCLWRLSKGQGSFGYQAAPVLSLPCALLQPGMPESTLAGAQAALQASSAEHEVTKIPHTPEIPD